MTTLTLMPSLLAGTVTAPSSKSMGHRFLICAALAQGESWIRDVSFSKDIAATRRCLEALGATIMEGPGEKAENLFVKVSRLIKISSYGLRGIGFNLAFPHPLGSP